MKKILAIILSAIMLIGTMTTIATAEGTTTEVSTYDELVEALAEGGEIKLAADITTDKTINVPKSAVIDGANHKITYTSVGRVVDVKKDTNGADLTIKNLEILCGESYCERGINYNTTGKLTLDNVTLYGPNTTYSINLPGSAIGAQVEITNCDISGRIALNVWGANAVINATNTAFTSIDNTEVENYSAVKLNNDGTTSAEGAVINITGGSITACDEKGNLSSATSNGTNTGIINISETTVVTGTSYELVAAVDYGSTEFYGFSELQGAIDKGIRDDATVKLLKDIELENPIKVNGKVTLDLNGKTITYNSTTQGEAMITNKGNLTIKDSGETGVINYNYTGAADPSYGKGNYTISNAGTLTVNGGKITIANLSGHAKYPIDNNSTTGDAILVINGGHLYNYNTSAIRQFCNSTTNKNSVTIDGGLVEGYCAIWVQNPGSKTVNGSLSIKNGEIKSTAKAWVNGTAELKDVSSRIYCTIDGEGGAWSEDSAVSITGGTINENVSLAEEAPAAITIGDEATFNGYVDIPEEEVDKTLPNAEVKNIGSVTIPANGYSCYPSGDTSKDLELDVAMQFIAKDTPEEAAKNYYGNYTTDFFIEFDGLEDGSFDTTGCYLAGNYGDWGWIAIPVNTLISTVEEGVVYPVLSSQGDLFDFKYVDICREVKDFTCGIYFSDAVKAANPNITVKLSLGLCESLQAAQAAQFTTVGAYTYDQDDFGKQLVNWGTGTDAGYYMDGETKYGMMRFLFTADIDAEDVVDSGIKYVRTDNIAAAVVSKKDSEATNAFYGDITGIPEGTTGEYAAVAYIVTTKGLIYWSDAAVCSPSFTKHFTGYTAQ